MFVVFGNIAWIIWMKIRGPICTTKMQSHSSNAEVDRETYERKRFSATLISVTSAVSRSLNWILCIYFFFTVCYLFIFLFRYAHRIVRFVALQSKCNKFVYLTDYAVDGELKFSSMPIKPFVVSCLSNGFSSHATMMIPHKCLRTQPYVRVYHMSYALIRKRYHVPNESKSLRIVPSIEYDGMSYRTFLLRKIIAIMT